MTHGAPDYSNVQKHGGIYRLDDMAELAARLGSLMSYDRRGDIFWSYGFDRGIGDFTKAAIGAGAAVNLTNTYFYNAPYSLNLKSGGAIGNLTRISRIFPVPYDLSMGFSFAVRPTATTDSTEINILHYTGALLYFTKLVVNYTDGEITITNVEDDPYMITDEVSYLNSSYVFNQIKLVLELETHALVRFGLNSNSYPLAGYTMKSEASAVAERIYIDILNKNTAAQSTDMFVDNIIITTNEV